MRVCVYVYVCVPVCLCVLNAYRAALAHERSAIQMRKIRPPRVCLVDKTSVYLQHPVDTSIVRLINRHADTWLLIN